MARVTRKTVFQVRNFSSAFARGSNGDCKRKLRTKAKSHLGNKDLGTGHSVLKLLMSLFKRILLLKSSAEWNLKKSAKAVYNPL